MFDHKKYLITWRDSAASAMQSYIAKEIAFKKRGNWSSRHLVWVNLSCLQLQLYTNYMISHCLQSQQHAVSNYTLPIKRKALRTSAIRLFLSNSMGYWCFWYLRTTWALLSIYSQRLANSGNNIIIATFHVKKVYKLVIGLFSVLLGMKEEYSYTSMPKESVRVWSLPHHFA